MCLLVLLLLAVEERALTRIEPKHIVSQQCRGMIAFVCI